MQKALLARKCRVNTGGGVLGRSNHVYVTIVVERAVGSDRLWYHGILRKVKR